MADTEHRFSPSRYLDFAKCGKKYELTRLHRMPEHEAWFFVGGTAGHLATEMYDRGDPRELQVIWNEAFEQTYTEAFEKDPDEDDWRAGKGYSGKGQPEGYREWNVKGLQILKDWVAWRTAHSMWELEGIEEELKATLPSGAAFHGFVDRLWRTPQGLVVQDIKTGSRQPDSLFQLGTYASVYELLGRERPRMGQYWMSKNGVDQKPPVSLDNFSLRTINEMSRMMNTAIDHKIFLPIVSSQCYYCTASDACYTVSGDTEQSRKYDPLNPEYVNAAAAGPSNPTDQARQSTQANATDSNAQGTQDPEGS